MLDRNKLINIMENATPNIFKNVVLPPEASTNWLFNQNVLFNLLLERKCIYMDKQDFYRYKRLASISDLDFTKYFLLTLCRKMKILQLVDYRMLCPAPEISKSLESIKDSRLLKDTKRYEDIVFSGYCRYLDYISVKEKVIPYIGNSSDKEAYRKEQIAAEKHIDAINRGLFGEEERRSYLRRLSTKLLTAQIVCKKLNGSIFDSREYQRGVTLLRKVGLFSESIIFDTKCYNRSKPFDKLISLCDKNKELKLSFESSVSGPGFMDIWLPYVFLQTLSEQDRECISKLELELQEKSKVDLKNEIYEWLLANRKDIGIVDGNKFAKEAISTTIGFVPIAAPIFGFYKLFQLLFSTYSMRKTNISNIAQLIGVALLTEQCIGTIDMKYSTRNWIMWFCNIFKNSERDSNWILSQREMGSWTKTDLYIPWYEYSQDKLSVLKLI